MIHIFWFRRDLRINDNHGLFKALSSGHPVKPIFIFDTTILDGLNREDARVTFIHDEVCKIDQALRLAGSSLTVYYGKPVDVWKRLIENYTLAGVYWNEDYEPQAIERDKQVTNMLKSHGIPSFAFTDQVIHRPGSVLKDDATPYTVFTPFSKKWKALLTEDVTTAFPSADLTTNWLQQPAEPIPSLTGMGFSGRRIPAPSSSLDALNVSSYSDTRNYPSHAHSTSRLSVHLRFGTISIRELVRKAMRENETYLNELIWREFYMHILWHFPHVVNRSFKPEYDRIQWVNDQNLFNAWKHGKTGVPFVDAGMRELVATGYMHNRARMITASYLTKNLHIDWRWGEAFFAEHLLDFELASNNGGWQWAAGCGTDAAPYFRIFNPYLQAQKFDANQDYIKKWIPEINTPAYPEPIVDFGESRKRCLTIYQQALTKQSTLWQ